MGLLDTQIKKQVAAALKGRLLRGTLRRVAGSAVDDFGDLVPGTATTYAIEGLRESYSATYRARAGIPAEDVQFLVILGLVASSVVPQQGDQIKLTNTGWHQVRTIPEIDPAGASAKCQCYAIPDPT